MSNSSDCRLPDGWATAELGTIADIIGGGTPSRGEARYFSGDIVWLTPTEIPKETVAILSDSREKLTELGFRESSVRWVPQHSVLLTSRASIGYTAIAGTALTTNQGFASFTLSSGIEPKYLAWWLKAQKKRLEELAGGTTFKEISKATLRTVTIPIAPAAEQKRIVAAIEEQFTRLDAGVAALKRAQAALKRYRAAVLKAAVEGKLTEAWRVTHPDVEPASTLLGRILDERQAKWEADLRAKGKDPAKARYEEPKSPQMEGLPELPQGWVWVTVEQVIGRSEYGTSVKCSYEAEGVPVLRIPNIAAGEIDLADMKYATVRLDIGYDDQLQTGDLLMCRTNGSVSLIGKAAVIRSALDRPHTFASYLLRFRLVETGILPTWLHLFISSPQGRRFIEGNAASSAGQHNISLTLIHRMPIPLPSLGEQEQIVAEAEQRLSIIAELEAIIVTNLKRAERLRQAILEQAFTGRLVPQDATDEPARVLLERIRRMRGTEQDVSQEASQRSAEVVSEPRMGPVVASLHQRPLWHD